MEDLLRSQKTEIDELNRIIANYKKDSPDRKTERYLNDKKATFTEAFRVIKDHDGQIQYLREPKFNNQPYFTEQTFEKMNDLYLKTITDIDYHLGVYEKQKNQTASQPIGTSNAQTTTAGLPGRTFRLGHRNPI